MNALLISNTSLFDSIDSSMSSLKSVLSLLLVLLWDQFVLSNMLYLLMSSNSISEVTSNNKIDFMHIFVALTMIDIAFIFRGLN